jgi:hypothetical protein
MPDDKKGRVKVNPKIVEEHKREQKEGYKGTVEDYYKEFYGPIPEGFEKGGMMSDGVSKKGMGVEKKMGGGMMSDGVAKKGSGIEMKSKGGMVRGQGAAIRGTKFKGIF